MVVTKEQADPCTVSLEIEVDPETVERGYDRAYREFAGVTRVPGFRPGKAPRSILERYVSADRVAERVREIIANRAYQDALRQEGIAPYDDPDVDLPEIVPGETFRFKANVPLAPKVELGDYTNLTIERPVITIRDEDVDAQIEMLRGEHARVAAVEGRGIQDGDIAITELSATLAGDEPAEPSRTLIRLGNNIPGFDLNILGQQVDEERTFSLKYPDDYETAERAGKNVTFRVKLVAINERVPPELDDAWVASVTPFRTVAELRDGVREELQRSAVNTSEEIALSRVMEALIQRSTIEFPRVMVEREAQRDMARLQARLDEQDATYEAYLEHNKITAEEHRAQLMARAEERVRNRLVLRALMDREGLELSDTEVDVELGRLLDENEIDTRDARRLMKSERHRSRVETMIAQRKLNDLLRRIATMKDVPVEEREPAASAT